MTSILNIQTKNITLAALVLGGTSLVSALLGLFRDRLLAGNFGAGNELDIYYTAFRIPDFIAMVLVMGAIGAAIMPIFSEYLVHSKGESWKFLSNILNLFLVGLILVSGVLFLLAPFLISLIAPGFEGEKREMTIALTRIMLLSPILLGISNIISSILRVFRRFLISSLAPIMYNLGIIAGIFLFVPKIGILGLAWGVVLGGALHLLIQLPILFKVGFNFQKVFNFNDPGFIRVIKLTIPRSIGLAAAQINLIVIVVIASGLAGGSIAIFNLAESLSRPLLTFIGISFSAAAFPTLSLAFSKKNKEKFVSVFFSTFKRILYLIVPLSILLFLLREQIVNVILGVGKFDLLDSSLTAACLGMFTLGIFAQSLTLLVAKAFYAIQNTKIPALASVIGMLVNISLAFWFVNLLSFPNAFQRFLVNLLSLSNLDNIQIIGLPLALSLAAIVQFIILFILFSRKIKEIN